MAELLHGKLGVRIPTYVRNDNSTVVCQSGSVNTVADAKRLNNFLGSIRDGLGNTERLSTGYITGGMSTSDGLTKSKTGVKLRRLLNGDVSQITRVKKKGIRMRTCRNALYFVSRNHTRAKGLEQQHKDEDARGKKLIWANRKGEKDLP